MQQKSSINILFLSIISLIIVYYLGVLLHEWGHGTCAWLFGVKQSPLDVDYGSGYLLLHVDEGVDYNQLLASGRGVVAALIGICGMSVNILLAIVSIILLKKKSIKNYPRLFILIYWNLVLQMVPIIQYIPLTTFSTEGDIGRFITGLGISPWWVFIIGGIIVIYTIWYILKNELIKAYAYIPVTTLLGQRSFLLATLCLMFLLIYTHGYNPISDHGTPMFSKILAGMSILAVPVLYIMFDPKRSWVQKRIDSYKF